MQLSSFPGKWTRQGRPLPRSPAFLYALKYAEAPVDISDEETLRLSSLHVRACVRTAKERIHFCCSFIDLHSASKSK